MSVTWWSDGDISGYAHAVKTDGLTHDTYKIGRFWSGPVDSQIPTRAQYPVWVGGNLDMPRTEVKIVARVKMVDANYAASQGHYYFAINAYFVPDSPLLSSQGPPSPAQIRDAARSDSRGFVKRSSSMYSITSGMDHTFLVNPVSTSSFSGAYGSKWWVAIIPVMYRGPNNVPAYSRNDRPAMEHLTYANGCRVLSVWTNRSPGKPAILGVPSGRIRSAGEYSEMGFTSADPDRDTNVTALDAAAADRAGVQIQYAPRPTPENPNVDWQDIPVKMGTEQRPGWYIWGVSGGASTLASTTFGSDEGVLRLHYGEVVTPVVGIGADLLLPGGEWQVRMRTFDWGHPAPMVGNPVGRSSASIGLLRPSNYPAFNTSPWSDPVTVTVEVQVPPPIPLAPTGNTAVVEGSDVTFRWRYRNTSVGQYPQAKRRLQWRQVGSSAWLDLTTVADETSAEPHFLVPGSSGLFLAGVQYEWRVQVEDSTGYESDWSSTARFWAVAAPSGGSGGFPVPSETSEGATLGCGTHRVFVYRRGGQRLVGEITNLSLVDWGRKRDDISTARVVVSGWDVDCGNLLAQLQTLAYEIVIIRDNGYSQDRVWEGPITLLTYESDRVVIQARDVMLYPYRRIIRDLFSDTSDGDSVVNRAVRILQTTMAPDDPNVLAHLHPIMDGYIPQQYRHTPPYSRTAFEEIDDMASNAGLDYTVVGRSILLWGTRNPVGRLPEFRDGDLGAMPIVTEYGMSFANYYAVSDGNGLWGSATRLQGAGDDGQGGEDPEYGIIEMLSSSWASDSAEDTTYTEAGRLKVIESFKQFSERSIEDRFPPPVVVRVPDNTTLNPNTVVSIQHLVPGVAIPLRATNSLREVIATQKLDSLRVVEEDGKESITISLSPFNRADDQIAEGDEI